MEPIMNNSNNNQTDPGGDSRTPEYQRPRFRRVELAAEEVLSTNCKQGGICDVLPQELGGTGAGS